MISELITHREGRYLTLAPELLKFLGHNIRTVSDERLYRIAKYVSAHSKSYQNATKKLYDVANDYFDDIEEIEVDGVDARIGLDEQPSSSRDVPVTVAKFPYVILQGRLDAMRVRLRSRISLTTCSFERSGGRTKLWSTIEAIPLDGAESWVGQPSDLVAIMEKMAQATLKPSAAALAEAILSEYGSTDVERGDDLVRLASQRIQITLADDFDPVVGAFLDAADFSSSDEPLDLAKIFQGSSSRAARGYQRFKSFVESVDRGAKIGPETIQTDLPGTLELQEKQSDALSSIITVYNKRVHRNATGEPVGVRVVGFARRLGIGNYRNFPVMHPELTEQLVHSASGARSASAHLAGQLSEQLENDAIPAVEFRLI